MSRRVIVSVVAAAVVVVAGVLVAVYIPGEHATRVIALTGVVIAAGKAAYDVWDKERERRKKADDGNEQYRVELKYQRARIRRPLFGVEVYNSGKTDVHIRYACLHLNDSSSGWRLLAMLTGPDHAISQAAKLEPKDAADFYLLPPNTIQNPESLLQMHEDNLYIEVCSYSGVIVRMDGKSIHESLSAIIGAVESPTSGP